MLIRKKKRSNKFLIPAGCKNHTFSKYTDQKITDLRSQISDHISQITDPQEPP